MWLFRAAFLVTLRTLYQYVSSLTRPVTILLKNRRRVKAVLVFYPPGNSDATNPVPIHWFADPPGDDIARQNRSCGAKRPCLPWKGVAERSESFKIMIAGGNHSTVKRWLSVSETGGVCPSTERFKITPQSARSGCQLPFQGRRGRFAPDVCHSMRHSNQLTSLHYPAG